MKRLCLGIALLCASLVPVFGQTTISSLPNATLPLGGTEVVPLVQGGVTKKAPVSAFGGGGGSGTPCTSTANAAQYNNAGSFGCVTGVTSNGTSLSFAQNDLVIVGSSTGYTSILSDNAGSTNYTLHIPAANDTVVVLSAAQTLSSKTLASPAFTGTVTGNGTIPNAVLVNSSITIAGHAVSLGGSQALSCSDLTGVGTGCSATIANYLPLAGGTMTGEIVTAASASGGAGINIPHGAAPSSPVNGDFWSTTAGFFGRVNGTTVGPFAAGGGSGSWNLTDGTTTITGVASLTVGGPLLVGGSGTAGTLNLTYKNNAQTGTTYTFVAGDAFEIVSASNASASTYTLPGSTTTNFTAGYDTSLVNIGAGGVTLASTSSFLPGAPVLAKGQSAEFTSLGGSGWLVQGVSVPFMGADTVLGNPSGSAAWPAAMSLSSCSGSTSAQTYNTSTHAFGCNTFTALATTSPGTGVATALGNNLSAAGGVTSTIASGTAALGTSAISSGACATVVTVSAPNVATTDVITAGFNGDPTAVTGYTPSTSGMLTIISYPTSGNVNFKACNNTGSSVTPGAITLNWRVVR